MGLEEQALDLAAFGLLPGFDLVDARTPAARTQPTPVANQPENLLCCCRHVRYSCFQRRSPSRCTDASLKRHTQRFLELRRGLVQIGYFCKGAVLKRMMASAAKPSAPAPPTPPPVLRAYLRQNGECQTVTGSGSAVQGRSTAIPEVEKPAQPPRQILKTILRTPSRTGRVQGPELIQKQELFRYSPA
jgi:hypothetical protein